MNTSLATLSEKEYWDEVLTKAELPRLNSPKNYSYRVTMDYIHTVLKGSEGKSLLEIGCGSSGWMPYFQKTYKLKVSGLDYSKVGCNVAVENLRMQGIPFSEIYCKDFLEENFSLPQKFDFIFSYGVVEHFNDTTQIIAIFKKLLTPGGVLITLVPNLNGFNGFITRNFMPDIYELHTVITNKQLKSYHTNNKLRIEKSNYVGTFSVAVFPFANSKNWFFKTGTKRRIKLLSLLSLLDQIFSKFFSLFKINLPTRWFAPYIICIAVNDNHK